MKIVGVAACTVGIAHTYIAREKLMEAFELDYSQAQSVTEMSVIAFCEIEKGNLARDLEKSRKKLELFQK